MAVYAIGDVQGCHEELAALLDAIGFDASNDSLWLVGDLVNRGPRSLEVLDLVRSLGERAVCVLGNHDLHLIAAAAGVRAPRAKDTFDDVLASPRRDALIEWLCARPLVHHDAALRFTMVHAGLPPQWSVDDALARARELESVLRGSGRGAFLREMYGNQPDRWSDDLDGAPRLRYIVNAFTRMRYCTRDGRLDVEESGPPGTQPAGLVPWYEVPGRASAGERIVFGHWSTMSLGAAPSDAERVFGLDTGCVWGGALTALRLDDLARAQRAGTLDAPSPGALIRRSSTNA